MSVRLSAFLLRNSFFPLILERRNSNFKRQWVFVFVFFKISAHKSTSESSHMDLMYPGSLLSWWCSCSWSERKRTLTLILLDINHVMKACWARGENILIVWYRCILRLCTWHSKANQNSPPGFFSGKKEEGKTISIVKSCGVWSPGLDWVMLPALGEKFELNEKKANAQRKAKIKDT